MSISPARVVSSLALFVAAALPVASSASAHRAFSPSCDATLWRHVYNPGRLTKVQSCITVTGTIRESHVEDDGDQHFLLDLDPGQKKLLNKRNMKKKDGYLVVEIVCANPVKLKKVRGACAGYHSTIATPPPGTHVSVTGVYVIDDHNGWAEIHPVSRIETIR